MSKVKSNVLLKTVIYIGSLVVIFITTVLATKYYFYDSDYAVKKTDLSIISINDIKLGMNILDVDLSKYTKIEDIRGDCNYNFSEMSLKTDENGVIEYIIANFKKIDLYVGQDKNATKIKKINEVWKLLGSNYKNEGYKTDINNYWKISRYIDKDNDIYLGLVYSRYNNELSEIILSNERIKD